MINGSISIAEYVRNKRVDKISLNHLVIPIMLHCACALDTLNRNTLVHEPSPSRSQLKHTTTYCNDEKL